MTTHETDPEALWTSLVDSKLSPEEFARLQQLLAQDPSARRRYIDLMLLDTMLAEELASESIGDMVDALSPAGTNAAKSAVIATPVQKVTSMPRFHRRWFATAMAAGLLVCAAVWQFSAPQAEASAASLVGETLRVHQLPLDRCYVIQVDRSGEAFKSWAAARPRVDRLWTRGDRFFLESSTDRSRWKWGQDADGRVWMTHGPQRGLTIEPNELPVWLAGVCDALAMRVEPMLEEVLANFDLTWAEEAGDPRTKVVRAVNTRNAQPRWLKEARLEIDAETKVLRKLTVVRQVRSRQAVTVTYTLAASESQPDNCYELKGHLTEPSVVYSRSNQPQKRFEALADHFGPLLARTMFQLEREPPTENVK